MLGDKKNPYEALLVHRPNIVCHACSSVCVCVHTDHNRYIVTPAKLRIFPLETIQGNFCTVLLPFSKFAYRHKQGQVLWTNMKPVPSQLCLSRNVRTGCATQDATTYLTRRDTESNLCIKMSNCRIVLCKMLILIAIVLHTFATFKKLSSF